MGWCNHPKRKTGNDVRVLVRAAELPCRNAWADDLWAEASGDERSATIPAHQDPLQFTGDIQTDAVVALGIAHADGEIDAGMHDAQTAMRSGGNRDQLRRARQELKERNRSLRSESLPLFGGGDGGSLGTAGELGSYFDPSAGASFPVESMVADPVPVQQPAAPTRDVSVFDSVPTITGDVVLPLAASQSSRDGRDELVSAEPSVRQQRERTVPVIEVDPTPATNASRRPIPSREDRTVWPTEPSRRSSAENPSVAGRAPRDEHGSQPEREEIRKLRRERVAAEAEFESISAQESASRPDADQTIDDERSERSVRDGRRSQPRVAPARERRDDDVIAAEAEPELELGDDYGSEVFEEAFPSDRVVAITPLYDGVPHNCSTCKDFRPAESGLRGWCNNTWAFGHPRMVGADELPCASLAGDWWVPSVDALMEPLDISAHANPTPLLDHWIAARRRAAGEEEEAPIRRRKPS